jgi:hypothetical protein
MSYKRRDVDLGKVANVPLNGDVEGLAPAIVSHPSGPVHVMPSLVAAAPDLLRVCKLALASWFNGEVSEVHMQTELAAAIAKAEGR